MKSITPILVGGLLGLSAIGATTAISQDGSEPVRTVLPDKPAITGSDREMGKPLRARNNQSANQKRGPRGPRGARGPAGSTGAPGAAGPQGPAGANGSAALASYVGSTRFVTGYDSTTLVCPSGKAVSGGFLADSSATVLNGERPTPDGRGWVVEVTYMGQTSSLWSAFVVCMA